MEMSRWFSEDPSLEPAKEINQKLKAHGMPEFVAVAVTDKGKAKLSQMRYIFDEWLGMFRNLNPDSELDRRLSQRYAQEPSHQWD